MQPASKHAAAMPACPTATSCARSAESSVGGLERVRKVARERREETGFRDVPFILVYSGLVGVVQLILVFVTGGSGARARTGGRRRGGLQLVRKISDSR